MLSCQDAHETPLFRYLRPQDSNEQYCFICGMHDMSLHLLAAYCDHAQRSHWNAAQMRFLQSLSRRCCLLKWVQMGLMWCAQPAEAPYILAAMADFLQVLCRQCTKDSIPSILALCMIDLARLQEHTCEEVEGAGEKAWAPKPLLCAPAAEWAPLSVLPKVDGPKGSPDAVLSGPKVGSDRLQISLIHEWCLQL